MKKSEESLGLGKRMSKVANTGGGKGYSGASKSAKWSSRQENDFSESTVLIQWKRWDAGSHLATHGHLHNGSPVQSRGLGDKPPEAALACLSSYASSASPQNILELHVFLLEGQFLALALTMCQNVVGGLCYNWERIKLWNPFISLGVTCFNMSWVEGRGISFWSVVGWPGVRTLMRNVHRNNTTSSVVPKGGNGEPFMLEPRAMLLYISKLPVTKKY